MIVETWRCPRHTDNITRVARALDVTPDIPRCQWVTPGKEHGCGEQMHLMKVEVK